MIGGERRDLQMTAAKNGSRRESEARANIWNSLFNRNVNYKCITTITGVFDAIYNLLLLLKKSIPSKIQYPQLALKALGFHS